MQTVTFASDSAITLLERLSYQVNHAVHSSDADSIHDLRTATRRFAQSLFLFKGAFPTKEVKKIRRRLGELMDLTNEPRDCDIALKLVSKSELPGAKTLEPAIRARRKETLQVLLPRLRRWGARETSSKWRAALQPNGSCQDPLEDSVRQRVQRPLKQLLKDGGEARSAQELHQVRIAAKKLRYSLELLQSLYGQGLDAVLGDIQVMQTLLGDANDCHAVRALIVDLGGDADVEGWLKKRQKKKTREFQTKWPAIEDSLRMALILLRMPARSPVARVAAAPRVMAFHA
jgi:CHAD domain-containing protein